MSAFQVIDGAERSRRTAFVNFRSPTMRILQPSAERLAFLASYARDTLEIEGAAIDIFDPDLQWTVLAGTPVAGISPRADSLSENVLSRRPGDFLRAVDDCNADEDLRGNPWVDGTIARIRMLAALPVRTPDGTLIGALRVWSSHGRTLGEHEKATLRVIRDAVTRCIAAAVGPASAACG